LLKDRHVLITGAAGAIGSAIAQSMIDHGARVTRTDRVAGEGVILLDACSEASVRRGFEAAGTVTDVVHAAGTLIMGPIAATETDEFRAAVDSNLTSAYLIGRVAAQKLGRGATLTFISSQASYRAAANWGVYCAVKAGVSRLAEALAQELGPKGVRVNAVCPGIVLSPMIEEVCRQAAILKGKSPAAVLAGYKASIPMGRLADPREIGDVCVFLASPLASYVSGASIPVDGGEVSA
jgi:NAD(P)-dependent dehydrogenase (short-subunit alcohol dehydrogenase family)